MTVLITGGAGFVGGFLTRRLVLDLALSDRAVMTDIVSNPRANPNLSSLDFEYHEQSCDGLPNDLYGAHTVIHLTAQASVPFAIKSPKNTWKVNTGNFLEVIEKIRHLKEEKKSLPPHLILISSESTLGDLDTVPAREEAPYRPVGMYGASKAAEELMGYAYSRGYGLPITVLRSGTMFGPYCRMDQAIPYFLMQGLKGEKITLQSPNSTRDFNYVENMVDAVLLTMKAKVQNKLTSFDIFHIASGEERKIIDVATTCFHVAREVAHLPFKQSSEFPSPKLSQEIEIGEPRPGEEGGVRLALDISKAKEKLGYEPRVKFEEGLVETANWLKDVVTPK